MDLHTVALTFTNGHANVTADSAQGCVAAEITRTGECVFATLDGPRALPWRDVRAVVSYTVNNTEHARRIEAGGGALLSPDVLETMLGLPLGEPVPVATLTDRERRALPVTPQWAVQVEDGSALRLAVAPVSVNIAVVAARSWRHGLELAGRFAPFCTRAVVLDAIPRDDQKMRMEADFYGVGVTVVRGEDVEVLVKPTPWRRVRTTAAGWRFAERVYTQHRYQEAQGESLADA